MTTKMDRWVGKTSEGFFARDYRAGSRGKFVEEYVDATRFETLDELMFFIDAFTGTANKKFEVIFAKGGGVHFLEIL